MKFLKTNLPQIILWTAIVLYAAYFSTATIYRMHAHAAHYYDLGIMHQTTYNTYKALTTGDFSRFLEMTNTKGPDQIKRMAIHNDLILAVIAPFYAIYTGPETLLVIQSIVLAVGAYGLFLTVVAIFKSKKDKKLSKRHIEWIAVVISLLYLLNPVLQFANLFEFHGVTLATTFLIFMFYFWFTKRYMYSFLFAVLSMLTKEQVALTVFFFALYIVYSHAKELYFYKKLTIQGMLPHLKYPALLGIVAVSYFFISLEVIIPYFRGGSDHFALKYYGEISDSPTGVIVELIKNPFQIISYLFSEEARKYLWRLFLPVAFLSFISPATLAIAAPEFGINLISTSSNMRNIYFHYTAVLTPFIFLSLVYSIHTLIYQYDKRIKFGKGTVVVLGVLVVCALYSAYRYGPLPYAKYPQTYMFRSNPVNKELVYEWAQKLKDDSIKVSATGKFAPFFTSRRYFYDLSKYYSNAEYIVVNPKEVYAGFNKERAIPGYEALQLDKNYDKIVTEENFEVYKKKQNAN